ncbi:M28 family peptidase [Croceicoccus mobilis]|uniref:Aminopeptidase n=1 Tax=Croceicoccus mobilis TaxID=1703339 RepID=A0A916Z5F6_9SPHN|nr:M28 family peptidase [Croceicoccus mobilis]GGD77572.1 aminopeptidase [Croceicoccus mobilis]
MLKTFLRCGAAFLVVSTTMAVPSAQADEASTARLERDVRMLADDNMEGREAGTAGYAMAAGYVAGQFAAIGLTPAGDEGTYFQSVPLVEQVKGPKEAYSLTITGKDAPSGMQAWVDYGMSSKAGFGTGEISGEMVFVGYGLVAPEYGRDDLAGVDLKGKIAVRLFGAPRFLGSEEGAHYRSTIGQRLSDAGAVGMIVLFTPGLEQLQPYEQYIEHAHDGTNVSWQREDGTGFTTASNIVAGAVLSPEYSKALMDGQQLGWDQIVAAEASEQGALPAFAMGQSATLRFSSTTKVTKSPNVVAMLPGTNPALADQAILLTAHLDHVGIQPTEEEGDDEIYNGAMDNAVGVASLMEVARTLAANPPARPVIFTALTAEEKGLVGSSYLAHHLGKLPVPVAANLNLDMPIVTYPFSDVIAFGAERSNLQGAVEKAVGDAGLTLSPDPQPEQGLFTRSDQYSFVKQGVPAVYLKTGFAGEGEEAQNLFRKEHYHKASDEADGVDYAQLDRFVALNAAMARAIADMAERPAWNAGDFFGTTFTASPEK